MSRTVPQTPNNAFTPSAISVATSTGFTQGDLVYQSNTGNFGRIPDNAVSTDTFNIFQNSPILAAPNSGSVIAANTTGSSYGIYAATLSNGNIVQVYQRDEFPRFKITDVNNTVVVAETIISSTFTLNLPSLSVAALSGGGFVVSWANTTGGTANKINYAIYTNTGAVTLAATQDTTFTGTFNPLYVVYPLALPNGGFVLVGINTSNAGYYRIYNASGTGLYATTALTGSMSNPFQPALAARSDSSFIVATSDGSSSLRYTIISATNTVLVTSTTFTSTIIGNNIFNVSATCLTDGNTFVIGYIGNPLSGSPTSAFRFLPTGNTLSSETFFTNSISNSQSNSVTSVSMRSLASGNFLFLFSEFGGLINYAVFNSSGVCISGTNAGAAIPKRIWAGQVRSNACLNTVILTSTSINIYWTYSTALNGNWGLVQSLVRLGLTTYDPIPVLGTTVTIGTTTAGVSGYNIATATPTSAKFSAASTSVATSTQSIGFVRSETVINSNTCYALHSATLMNGNFVVAYASRNAPYAITAAIYTPAGLLITSFAVASSGTAMNSSIKIAALSGGNFVVTYATGASSPYTLNNAVYTSGGSLVGTSIVTANGNLDDSQYGFGVAGITNNRFVVVWSNDTSQNLSFRVFDSSGVALTTAASTGYAGLKPSVATYFAGGFGISAFTSGSTIFIARLDETSTNTFSPAASYNIPAVINNTLNYSQLSINSNNQAGIIVPRPNIGAIYYTTIPYDLSSAYYNAATSTVQIGTVTTGAPVYANCFTSYGNAVIFQTQSSPPTINIYPVGINGNTNNITTTFQPGNTYSQSQSEAQVNLTPLYGNVVLCTYKDTSNIPKFFIFNATPYTATQQITAGVTASNGIALGQPMGYSLAGVAATTATAGSVGQVQTNGIATLNSSYNASTPAQSFDFQNNTGVGVKGTITGRSVTLQGNV